MSAPAGLLLTHGAGGGADHRLLVALVTLDPDAIAEAYLQFHNQHRSAWAWEVELRPWVEKF